MFARMPYRILDLQYSPRLRGIDDAPLQQILHGHDLLDRKEFFYERDGIPHLLVAVHYRLACLDRHPTGPQQMAVRPADPNKTEKAESSIPSKTKNVPQHRSLCL